MSDLDLSLSHLDFEKESIVGTSSPELPSRRSNIQVESGRPSSFHSLLAQNEDLAANLRVTLQRLATTEDKNKRLMTESESIQGRLSAFADQILIWKEKEKIWKQREFELEKHQRDQERELEIESSLLRQKAEHYDQLEEKLSRYQKYHEKIKTSVKPYIAQLKGYVESLHEQTRQLNQSILQKEMFIQELEAKLLKSREETESLATKAQSEKNQLIGLFEEEREFLRQEIAEVKAQNETLTEKTRILERSLERQDELENLVVALRRTKEEQTQKFQKDGEGLRQQLRDAEAELTLKALHTQDLQKELESTKLSFQNLTENAKQSQEQLVSLRYMWTQKTQECEKLRMTSNSLEKINLDLSQKLNALRKDLELS